MPDLDWIHRPGALENFWRGVASLARLAPDDLVAALGDLTDDEDASLEALCTAFVTAWNLNLIERPELLRSLRLPYELLETRAESEGRLASAAALRQVCPYLQTVIDDDLLWTFTPIPGERPDEV